MSAFVSRREFLQVSATAVGGGLLASPSVLVGAGAAVAIVVARDDRVANEPCVTWAIGELRLAIERRGALAPQVETIAEARTAHLAVVIAGSGTPHATAILERVGVHVPQAPDALAIVSMPAEGRRVLLSCGHDARGLMYAVLELEDRVAHGDSPLDALTQPKPVVEQPLNAVRAIGRPFVSDVEDKAWFNDREFWPAYFGMLARQRFNRFHLALGFGYDTLRWVTDAYLLFPYPFLVAAPGHDVRAVNLPDDERDRNLATLRHISREAAAHGIDFQLGLWTHGYTWADSPRANYTIAGLTPANHASYCRDAMAAVLQACPDITGVTMRTHYESGVKEGSYAFWKTIFDGVPRSGRRLEIELHTKGLDETMIDGARSTGMPIRLSAKYWAEHMGLPYHQAAIRDLELPHVDPGADAFSALSMGSRNHTRYGYADFIQEGRPYGLMYRVFPGSHKLLLWGDPVTAAAHARAFQFCGSDGVELFEPLSFKGRRGSGLAGDRRAYLNPAWCAGRDWEKYVYTYRVWGRLMYNPACDPDVWRRPLRASFGAAAPAVETALGSATRILPLITTAHLPSAAHDTYSPEFYTNQSITDPDAPSPYGDTPVPKVFGTVSPLDPQLFSSVDEYVAQLLSGGPAAKYSPIQVAQWVDELADVATAGLTEAGRGAVTRSRPEFRQAAIDIRAQIGTGRFFAAKFRSAALYGIFKASGSRRALEEALRLYRQARAHWARFATELATVYVADITFGPLPHQRGHWSDRLPAIDADIAAMERMLGAAAAQASETAEVRAAIDQLLGRTERPRPACRHTEPASFVPGEPLDLALSMPATTGAASVRVHYRHVNQAERYQVAEMRPEGGVHRASIPAAYTASRFPLQYYFELREGPETASLYPGFGPDLANVPYFVVRQGPRR